MGRRGRISKHLLDGLKETREHWELKRDALDGTLRNWLEKRLSTCLRQISELMNQETLQSIHW
jgi:hypothetical protein